ncbi:alginate lyase family protein [Peribacillus sp. SCS-26]|uniref:alginate lyase family protein n=1 Tax=Paraperibacillus marinus TaxID=3115295 RepID=UPI0039059709
MSYEEALSKIKNRKDRPLFELLDKYPSTDLMKICEDLINNNFHLKRNFPAINLDMKKQDNIWQLDPLKDRSWRFQLHCLIMMEYLVKGFNVSKDTKVLDKAIAILMNWKDNNYPSSSSEMAWNDHSTALRLIQIANLFETLRIHQYRVETFSDFCFLADIHCSKLADSKFYRQNHNHGFDQDIALYVASQIFNGLPEANEWSSLAIHRIRKQLKHLFAEDGSYREHSPSYGVQLLSRIFKFMEFLKHTENQLNSDLERIVEKHIVFLSHICQPDGRIPNIGDSQPQLINLEKLVANSSMKMPDSIKYAGSKGKDGAPKKQLNKIFPDGGYAVFRNNWKFTSRTVQLVFLASFHSRIHKHHDDLSFTLFAHGIPLLIDAGKYNYNYSSKERQYVVSSRAHNSVIVDGSNTDISRGNIEKSGITDYFISEEVSFVCGVHFLYPGVIHERCIVFLSKMNQVFIFDNLRGKKEHTFEQIFNLSSFLKCSYEGNGMYSGMRNGKKLISIQSLLNNKHHTFFGSKEPMAGWNSLSYSKVSPNYQVVYKAKGFNTKFATHINLQPDQLDTQGIESFSWDTDKDVISFSLKNNINIELQIEKKEKKLMINNELVDVQHISK